MAKELIAPEYELMVAPVGPQGRGKLAGSHIADFAAQGTMILLCEFCNPKFNPKKNHYEVWRRDTWVTGMCDGCAQVTLHGRGFIHESTHDLVGEWEKRPAKRGRWSR